MRRRPDEDYDIVVYECRGTWTIWLAGDKQGERVTLESALEARRMGLGTVCANSRRMVRERCARRIPARWVSRRPSHFSPWWSRPVTAAVHASGSILKMS